MYNFNSRKVVRGAGEAPESQRVDILILEDGTRLDNSGLNDQEFEFLLCFTIARAFSAGMFVFLEPANMLNRFSKQTMALPLRLLTSSRYLSLRHNGDLK